VRVRGLTEADDDVELAGEAEIAYAADGAEGARTMVKGLHAPVAEGQVGVVREDDHGAQARRHGCEVEDGTAVLQRSSKGLLPDTPAPFSASSDQDRLGDDPGKRDGLDEPWHHFSMNPSSRCDRADSCIREVAACLQYWSATRMWMTRTTPWHRTVKMQAATRTYDAVEGTAQSAPTVPTIGSQ
jgi:hypothetical protein